MAKHKILVVDDSEVITKMLKVRLESTDLYEVYEENESSRGLETARRFGPDAILLDVMMPELGGDELSALFRQDRGLAKVPIVFLTAIVTKDEVPDGVKTIGGDRFLAKPIDVDALLECLADVIDNAPN